MLVMTSIMVPEFVMTANMVQMLVMTVNMVFRMTGNSALMLVHKSK